MCPLDDAIWRVALCKVWPFTLTLDVSRYVLASTGMVLLIWLFRRNLWAGKKIQARPRNPGDTLREITLSLRAAVWFSLVGVGIHLGKITGIYTLYLNYDVQGFDYMLANLGAMLLMHDTYFYWTHRAMHHRRVFRAVHRTHHLSHVPSPFSAYSFSMLENVVEAGFVPLWLLFMPTHLETLFWFMLIQVVRNTQGHCGYEFHPPAFVTNPILRWFTTITHHDLHHSTARYNYGLYFRWWDKLMGTEHPQYEEIFLRLARRERIDVEEVTAAENSV